MTGWNWLVALILAVTSVSTSLCGEIDPAALPSQTPAQPPQTTAQPTAQPPQLLLPEAPEELIEETSRALVDYSNTADGYVMVLYSAETDKRLKARVTGPTTEYTYDLEEGVWTTFPLSDGDGDYRVSIFENIEGTSYSTVLKVNFPVELSTPFAPFLRPNQYVDYIDAPQTLAKASELTAGLTEPQEKIDKIYNYLVENIEYDKEQAENVQSGYLSDLDQALAKKKGICLDYAALMTAMLRSQGIPCKLVVGYAGRVYHAWVRVWNGAEWVRMDPTFAGSGKDTSAVIYTEKFFY